MTLVLGVDGCPQGWCTVSLDTDTDALGPAHFATFHEVLATAAAVIAIDIPIGLIEGPGGRDCDRAARVLLGWPRMTSVFSPPARQTLKWCCSDYKRACRINFANTGRKISQQAFYIGPKIREVDDTMTRPRARRVYEAHPEVSFAALNTPGGAMRFRKSKHAGRTERWALLRRIFPELPPEPRLPDALSRLCDREDYIDALVCAWTAARIHAGEADPLPADPPRDNKLLRMAIWRPR